MAGISIAGVEFEMCRRRAGNERNLLCAPMEEKCVIFSKKRGLFRCL